MKNPFTIVIIILIITAISLGYFIFQQRTSLTGKELPVPISSKLSPEEIPDVFTTEEEFTIFIGENTKIFGIDQDNPYKGELPASIRLGPGGIFPAPDLTRPFEIFGDVFDIDLQEQVIRITTDAPRNIDTEFTPRGPLISLEDIKEGDRVVISDTYNEEGTTDFREIDFIQLLPPE